MCKDMERRGQIRRKAERWGEAGRWGETRGTERQDPPRWGRGTRETQDRTNRSLQKPCATTELGRAGPESRGPPERGLGVALLRAKTSGSGAGAKDCAANSHRLQDPHPEMGLNDLNHRRCPRSNWTSRGQGH